MKRIYLPIIIIFVFIFILTGCGFQLQKNPQKTGQIVISLNLPPNNSESAYPKWSWQEQIKGIKSQSTKSFREIVPGTDLVHIIIYNKFTNWSDEITIEIDPENIPSNITRTIEVPAGSGYKVEVFPWNQDFWASVTAGEAENITIIPNETTPVNIELKRTVITDLTIPNSIHWGENFVITATITTPVDIEEGMVIAYFVNNPDMNSPSNKIMLYSEYGLVFSNGTPQTITVNDVYYESETPVTGTYYLMAIGILYEDHPIVHGRYDLIWFPSEPITIEVTDAGTGSLQVIIQ